MGMITLSGGERERRRERGGVRCRDFLRHGVSDRRESLRWELKRGMTYWRAVSGAGEKEASRSTHHETERCEGGWTAVSHHKRGKRCFRGGGYDHVADIDNKLMNGIKVDGSSELELRTLNSGERLSIAKGLPGSLSVKAQLVVEALEGKRLDVFMIALKEVAEECGIIFKKLDKKLERMLLHSYRKDLILQVTSESDPVALLPKVIALLYLQVYNKALQAPGRALSSILSHLKDKLPSSTYEAVMDYHKATVTLLALLSAATGNEEYCSADRILSKRVVGE